MFRMRRLARIIARSENRRFDNRRTVLLATYVFSSELCDRPHDRPYDLFERTPSRPSDRPNRRTKATGATDFALFFAGSFDSFVRTDSILILCIKSISAGPILCRCFLTKCLSLSLSFGKTFACRSIEGEFDSSKKQISRYCLSIDIRYAARADD